LVFRKLHDKYVVTELFREIAQKIGDRHGGYTRIIKTDNRLGDNASMCFIELVDYNELMLKTSNKGVIKVRRSRRSSHKNENNVNERKSLVVQENKDVKETSTESTAEIKVE